LVFILLFFVLWSFYCCSLSFGRCIVVHCLSVAVLLRQRTTIQRPKDKQ
jgi:hypothetical protein